MFEYEDEVKANGFNPILGVDEAGRGPLAGPVVAAAVSIKDPHFLNPINDSKKLTPLQREKAFQEIFEKAYVGIGIINEKIIDQYNILNATYMAMNVAIRQLVFKYQTLAMLENRQESRIFLLIDGPSFKSDLSYPFKTIIDGDALSFSISCASIIAKVTRDRILDMYDSVYPQYGFRWHKGYPTPQHKKAIKQHGLSNIHRATFHY